MKSVDKLMNAARDQLNAMIDELLARQRSMIAGDPEKVIRLLALEQMAQYHDAEAKRWYQAAETFEAQECENIARHARAFAELIRTGKHQ